MARNYRGEAEDVAVALCSRRIAQICVELRKLATLSFFGTIVRPAKLECNSTKSEQKRDRQR